MAVRQGRVHFDVRVFNDVFFYILIFILSVSIFKVLNTHNIPNNEFSIKTIISVLNFNPACFKIFFLTSDLLASIISSLVCKVNLFIFGNNIYFLTLIQSLKTLT